MPHGRNLFATSIFQLAVLLLSLFLPSSLLSQEPPAQTEGTGRVRLFSDCKAFPACDPDYLRTEIQFVNWVRDIRDGDVYLLVTALGTGGGGRSMELIFTG